MHPLVRALVAGDEYHRTRLHDEKGNLPPLSALRRLPLNVGLVARRVATGRLPELPWFPWCVVERLDALVRADWAMVEFGSGMSTAWFARRVRALHSIEHDPGWYEQVRPRVEGLPGVRYELRPLDRYPDLSDHADGSLELAVVDGVRRADCVAAVVPKLRAGGLLYLDNSDKDMTIPGGDLRLAEERVLAAVAGRGGEAEWLTGLTVCKLGVHQGLLARL